MPHTHLLATVERSRNNPGFKASSWGVAGLLWWGAAMQFPLGLIPFFQKVLLEKPTQIPITFLNVIPGAWKIP